MMLFPSLGTESKAKQQRVSRRAYGYYFKALYRPKQRPQMLIRIQPKSFRRSTFSRYAVVVFQKLTSQTEIIRTIWWETGNCSVRDQGDLSCTLQGKTEVRVLGFRQFPLRQSLSISSLTNSETSQSRAMRSHAIDPSLRLFQVGLSVLCFTWFFSSRLARSLSRHPTRVG